MGCAFSIISICFIYSDSHNAILIESTESHTADGNPVYNLINVSLGWKQDSWEMKQSHLGPNPTPHSWEALKIIVKKNTRPYKVSFHQLKDGKETEYRVSCFLCHSNGPRAIYPHLSSPNAPLSLANKIVLSAWNLRIKSYGNMTTLVPPPLPGQKQRKVPLYFSGQFERALLMVKTCTFCHNENKWWGRGELQRQHLMPIKHMLKNQHMPPWPFKLSLQEQRDLANFTLSVRSETR